MYLRITKPWFIEATSTQIQKYFPSQLFWCFLFAIKISFVQNAIPIPLSAVSFALTWILSPVSISGLVFRVSWAAAANFRTDIGSIAITVSIFGIFCHRIFEFRCWFGSKSKKKRFLLHASLYFWVFAAFSYIILPF